MKRPDKNALLDAFTGKVPPLRPPAIYRLGLLVVAAAMVLVPAVYVGLVGLVAWGVYAVWEHSLVLTGLGGVLVLFMIKPLFAPGAPPPSPREVKREDQPLLFAFLDRLARAVDAPAPRQVLVTVDVNAAANLRGFWSMLRGDDLVLYIGLPLVAGLETRQLAGVLAHELGHFSQRAGMRLTYIIIMVNTWLSRVVFERDAWDERLLRWSSTKGFFVGALLVVARACIWLTRKVLWLLMAAGNLMSLFLMRQMEYDADRYQVHLTGRRTFEATARREEYLSASLAVAGADLSEFWSERRLPDSLPALVAANEQQIPPEVQQLIDQHLAEQEPSLLASHPPTAMRIARAAGHHDAPLFDHPGAAEELFDGFHALCVEVSLVYYNEVIDEEVTPAHLRPVEELLQRQKRRSEDFEALRRYFQDAVSVHRPLWLPDEVDHADVEEALAALEQDRRSMTESGESYHQQLRRYDTLDSRKEELRHATVLQQSGFRLEKDAFDLPDPTPEAVARAAEKVRRQLEELGQRMAPHEVVARRRLQWALWFLRRPETLAALEDGDDAARELARLRPVVNLLARVLPAMEPLYRETEALGVLLHNLEGNEEDEKLYEELMRHISLARGHLLDLEAVMDATLYPFSHGSGSITVHRHIVPGVPAEDDLVAQVEVSGDAVDRAQALYVAAMGRVATLAEAAEQALDLPPLPEPPRWDEGDEDDGEPGEEKEGEGGAGC